MHIAYAYAHWKTIFLLFQELFDFSRVEFIQYAGIQSLFTTFYTAFQRFIHTEFSVLDDQSKV